MSARQLRARLDRLTLSARTAVGQDRTAITGDPNASVDLLRQALETVIGEGEFIRALREPAEKLLEETEKLNLVTLFCLEKLAHVRVLELPLKDGANFTKGVAQTLLATAATMRAHQQMKPPEVPADNAKAIEHDDLEPAWAEMRKQLADMARDARCREVEARIPES